METQTNEKMIENNKFYVSCPKCNRDLLQGEFDGYVITRCDKCKKRIKVDTTDGNIHISICEE